MNFVILPHQLFSTKYLNKKNKYYIWEHPHYFLKYQYNKKKLILHYGSMKYYYDYLNDKGFDVKYIEIYDKFELDDYCIFDPIDRIKLPGKYTIIDTPNLILTRDEHATYRKKTNKFRFNDFYMYSKEAKGILSGIKSQDKLNRNKKGKNLFVPPLPKYRDKKYISYGIKKIGNIKNIGNVDNFIYPLTHKTAKLWLNDFLDKKFKKFGTYQDAIDECDPYLFHTVLSASINIGLLNPIEIIIKILKCRHIPLNSLEGLIRQYFWREFQAYCYRYAKFNGKNYFGNRNKLNEDWYIGNTGIQPVDDAIIDGIDSGYLHHIQRLMVIGNYMNLSRIAPSEGYRWFMEFSCDSYEWLMYQNVLDMVFFVSGGETTRKPYISSSNYILKMSNYRKDKWCDEWNKKYKDFIKANKDKLYKFRYHFRSVKFI